jgi:ABC-type uncharacterized transport system fused permease/ATPase subunit
MVVTSDAGGFDRLPDLAVSTRHAERPSPGPDLGKRRRLPGLWRWLWLAYRLMLREDVSLLERDAELAVIAERLAAACEGAGCLLLVEGPAGIGKTRLVRAACGSPRRARTSWHVASG